MKARPCLFLRSLLVLWLAWGLAMPLARARESTEVVYHRGDVVLKGFLCRPDGPGPFPAVVYNHGGLGTHIGGAPRETCEALAESGVVGFSPLRRQTISMQGHLDDVFAAVEYVKGLTDVDQDRLGLIGFSRGGHLAVLAGARRADFKAIVVMAAAPGGRETDSFLAEVQHISAPVLLLVADNDHVRVDHVQLIREIKGRLERAGRTVRLIVYPPYGDDGHQMFFEVGSYWRDVQGFLQEHLR